MLRSKSPYKLSNWYETTLKKNVGRKIDGDDDFNNSQNISQVKILIK